ncbi:hypothetical protein ACFW04_004306 [Cataglyphis niger]
MPKEAVVGSTIDLKCEWRILGGSGLYSVKWYKDDHEFFRFLPESSQRTQIFPRPGVKVETRPNNEKKSIKLKDLILESSGQYKCEVSTEAPSFATTYQTANLTVIPQPFTITHLLISCTFLPLLPSPLNLYVPINDSPEKITHPQFWLSLAAFDSWPERVNGSRVTRHVQNKTLHTYRNRQNCHIMDWTMRSQICETINARGMTSEITFVLYLKIKF